MATIDELRAVPREEFIAQANRLYKVGDDYYSYFPSTDKIELVSTVKDYSMTSFTLFEDMLSDISSANAANTYDASVETVTLFSNAINERQQYIQRELDNCNANLLLTSNDTKLLTYKDQLEAQLQQLTNYQTTAAEQLQIVLAALGTDAADKLLAEKINTILDQNFVNLVNQYNISMSETDLDSINKLLEIQKAAILDLQEKYTDIEDILINKRTALETGTSVVKGDDLLKTIDGLDTHISEYLNNYIEEVNALNIKVSALEKIYSALENGSENTTNNDTVTNVSSTDNTDNTNVAVTVIKQQYNNILAEQQALQDRIDYIEKLLNKQGESSKDAAENANNANNANNVLQNELNNLNAQNDALKDILSTPEFENISQLVTEQERIEGLITTLETTMQEADKLASEEQLAALQDVNTALQELISQTSTELTASNEEKLAAATDTLSANIDSLSGETKESLSVLQDALKDLGTSSETSLNEAVGNLNDTIGTLQTQLSADIEEQKSKREDLEKTVDSLSTLLDSTAEELSKAIDKNKDEQNAALDAKASELSIAIEANKNAQEKSLNDKATELSDNLTTAKTALELAIEAKAQEVTEALGKEYAKLSAEATDISGKVGNWTEAKTMTEYITNLSEKVGNWTDAQSITTKITNIQNKLDNLPKATNTTFGIVRADGSTITANNGVISLTNDYQTLLENLKESGGSSGGYKIISIGAAYTEHTSYYFYSENKQVGYFIYSDAEGIHMQGLVEGNNTLDGWRVGGFIIILEPM